MTATLTTAPVPPAVALELSRCDRCGAAGKTRFTLSTGNDLVLCGHHSREHADKLAPVVQNWETIG